MTKNHSKSFGIFSFFTGAVFLCLGIEDAGFKTMMANENGHDYSQAYLYFRKNMKNLSPKYGLQTDVACCDLEYEEKRWELAQRVREAPKKNAIEGFIVEPLCPDLSIANGMRDE